MPRKTPELHWIGFDSSDVNETEPVDTSKDVAPRRTNLEPRYDEESLSVVGFCPVLIEDPHQYIEYLSKNVFPLVDANQHVTRISNRAVIKRDLHIPFREGKYLMHEESKIPLGGQWKDFNFVMSGMNMVGRRLSTDSNKKLVDIVVEANQRHPYEVPKPLPLGFELEHLTQALVSMDDLDRLVDLFGLQYSSNTTDLKSINDVSRWIGTPDSFPVVVRDPDGQIVSVASGVMTSMYFRDDRFQFFEIGDTATHPDYQGNGINRRIKHHLISLAAKLGADSVHIETRAAVRAPNQSAARNGMKYQRTLVLDRRSKGGPVDFDETADPKLSPEARQMSSSNVWAITPESHLWSYYVNYREKKVHGAFA